MSDQPLPSGVERLVGRVVGLEFRVETLLREVAALRHQLAERDGETAALKTMLAAWPPAVVPVHH